MDINKGDVSTKDNNVDVDFSSYLFVKRLMDILISLLLIFILSPLLILVSLLVKFDGTKGKVFFQQERVGKQGELFKMYKFRSMDPNAEKRLEEIKHLNEIEGKMFKIKKDPRITKVGKIIRAYSIDELPQLINVVRGEMSLIGPRPPLTSEYKEYTVYDRRRLDITPGITGLWQVSGRNALTFSQMVELDLEYIRNVSLKNDLIIFFKTIVVVLKKENAY